MTRFAAARARRVLAALANLGWHTKRQSGSHRTLARTGWPDFVFAFHEARKSGLKCWPVSPNGLACDLKTCEFTPDSAVLPA
jgi:predicted RNA binding protein YcfA (HicA-like mRNA interferase family)